MRDDGSKWMAGERLTGNKHQAQDDNNRPGDDKDVRSMCVKPSPDEEAAKEEQELLNTADPRDRVWRRVAQDRLLVVVLENAEGVDWGQRESGKRAGRSWGVGLTGHRQVPPGHGPRLWRRGEETYSGQTVQIASESSPQHTSTPAPHRPGAVPSPFAAVAATLVRVVHHVCRVVGRVRSSPR